MDIKNVVLLLLLIVIAICIVSLLMIVDLFRTWRERNCQHLRTRCIHGDEINARMKVYIIRFWKHEVIHRQICLDCGKPLNREAICTVVDMDQHTWEGSWPGFFLYS
jgi:hypothetical protein